jgi:hypothetical protein
MPIALTLTRAIAAAQAKYLLGPWDPSPSPPALVINTLILPWLMLFFDPLKAFTMLVPSVIALPGVWRLTARDDALIMGPYSASSNV